MFTAQAACGAFDFSTCNTVLGPNGYLTAISTSVLSIGWIVAAIFLAVGALQYITSAGDKGKATDAKTTLTNALIGIVVLLSIGAIFTLAQNIFGTSAPVTLPAAPKVTAP
jgi:TM2 domain-containing membrane protein YozV